MEEWGQTIDHPLKPDGEYIDVTEENVHEYVELYIDYVFNKSCANFIRSFKKGLYRVVDEALIKQLLKYEELEKILCGSRTLDFHAF